MQLLSEELTTLGKRTSRKAKRLLSRRELLRAAVITVAGAVVAAPIVDSIANRAFTLWNDEGAGAMVTGEASNLNQIPSEVPPSLEGKDIPTTNERFRQADIVFREGLRSAQESGIRLHFREPGNYLKTSTVLGVVVQDTENNPSTILEGPAAINDEMTGLIYSNDRKYSAFLNGSGGNITGIEEMIIMDPGTGLVKGIRDAMKAKYGANFDVWDACKNDNTYSPTLTSEQREFIISKTRDWYSGAMEFVQAERAKSDRPISTSVLFSYFLRENNGDILASVWDIAVWLKILARNDTDTSDPNKFLAFNPTYDKAKATTDLFQDESSQTISANWVIDAVGSIKYTDPNGFEQLNFTGNKSGDNYKYPKYKDFMPPNRAGGFYHTWNIIALMMCMDEEVVTRMVATHLNPGAYENDRWFSEYGRVKAEADMHTVERTREIRNSIRQYTSS